MTTATPNVVPIPRQSCIHTLRTAPKRWAADIAGWTYKHFQRAYHIQSHAGEAGESTGTRGCEGTRSVTRKTTNRLTTALNGNPPPIELMHVIRGDGTWCTTHGMTATYLERAVPNPPSGTRHPTPSDRTTGLVRPANCTLKAPGTSKSESRKRNRAPSLPAPAKAQAPTT